MSAVDTEVTLCSTGHPDYPDVVCDKPTPCYYFHSSRARGGLFWGECPEPPKRSGKKTQIAEIVSRATPESHSAPGTYAGQKRQEYLDGRKDPDLERWVDDACQTLFEWLKHRQDPFTTAEDVWCLLDHPPGDMRVMRRVVSTALRRGWITEVDAKRLNDRYRTKDGHVFEMNKLVPIYQSLLSRVA